MSVWYCPHAIETTRPAAGSAAATAGDTTPAPPIARSPRMPAAPEPANTGDAGDDGPACGPPAEVAAFAVPARASGWPSPPTRMDIGCGRFFAVVSPWPSCPKSLRPKEKSSPDVQANTVWK